MVIKTYDLYIPLGPSALPRHLRVPFFYQPYKETIHDAPTLEPMFVPMVLLTQQKLVPCLLFYCTDVKSRLSVTADPFTQSVNQNQSDKIVR